MTLKTKLRGVFRNSKGALRTGWRIALGIAAYAAAFYAVLWGLGALFGALFSAWGLTTSNVAYAPAWARWIVSVHTGFAYGAAYLASLAAGLWMAKRWTKGVPLGKREALIGLLTGLGLGALTTAISLIPDCMRLEWPLNEPVLGWSLLGTILLILLGKISGAALVQRLLFDPIRLRFGKVWGVAAACLASLILSGRWTNAAGAVNALLMGWIGCEIYLRGGLWASAAFETGWTAVTAVLFASPAASSASLYRLYHVSEGWLTGGNAGAECGLACTLGCLAILTFLYRKSIRKIRMRIKNGVSKHGKNQDCNCGTGIQGRGMLRPGADGNAGSGAGGRHRRA